MLKINRWCAGKTFIFFIRDNKKPKFALRPTYGLRDTIFHGDIGWITDLSTGQFQRSADSGIASV
jgi:hypothetical protein